MCCKTTVGFIKFADETEREDAIEVVTTLWNYRALTEAFPDQDETGEWIHSNSQYWNGGGFTRCSKCGYGFSDAAYVGVDRFDYCPHCGKRMKSANNI
jgi:hypothetical protein